MNKYMKKIMFALLSILLLLTSSTLAAVIITGEQSQDNDEYDQQITVDGTSEEGMKFIEGITPNYSEMLSGTGTNKDVLGIIEGATTETERQEAEQAYNIKTRIEAVLEQQLKKDMADNIKFEIDYVIYYSEGDLEDNIKKIWKETSGKEITNEDVYKITSVVTNTLKEYGYAKIDLWLEQYYKNNKDIIIEKIEEYVGNEGTDEDIMAGIGIVLYTAISPLEDEVKKIAQEIIDGIPEKVKEKVEEQKKFSAWEGKVISNLCTELPSHIANKFQTAFAEDFTWQHDKLYDGFRDIGSYSSDVSDEYMGQFTDVLKNSLESSLGYYSNLDIKDLLLQVVIGKADPILAQQITLVNEIVDSKTLTPQQMQTYYNTYNNILAQQKAKANRTHEQKVKEAHKALTESEKNKLIADANDWLQKELDTIGKNAETAALNAVNSEIYSAYITGMQDIKETIRLDQAMGVVREVDALLDAIEKKANETFKDIEYVSTALKKEETELDKQEKSELNNLKVSAGLELSDEKTEERDQLLSAEKEKRDKAIADIKQSDKYRQELTEENKAKRETEDNQADETHKENEKKIGQAFGQVVTEEQLAKQQAEKDAVNKEADKKIEDAKNENKELSKEIDKLAWEIAEEQVTSDEKYEQDIYNIKLEYGQVVTDEQKKKWDVADKLVDEKYDKQEEELKVLYGRELPENKKNEKQIRIEANDELFELNKKIINIEYGLQLPDDVQAEMDAKLKVLHDEEEMLFWSTDTSDLKKVLGDMRTKIEAVENDPKYKTKEKSDLSPAELNAYNKKINSAEDAHKTEENAIDNEYKLEKKEVINGVSYSDAKDKIDSARSAEKEKNEELYGKKELDDLKELEMETKIKNVEQQKQDRETQIKGKKNELKDLKKQNEKVEEKIEKIEKDREEKLETIEDKEEYKPRDFKDETEKKAYKDAMELEEERYEAKKKEIEEKYAKKKLTDEEKRAMNEEIATARQIYKENVEKIQKQYEVKEFEELTKAQQEAYKSQQKDIEKKYDDLRKKAKEELKAKKDAHKLVLQLGEIKCEQELDTLKNDYKNSIDMLEIAYNEGRITKDEYKEQKKKLSTEYEMAKQATIAAKQRVLDEERANWVSEKQFAYTVSTQIVTIVVQDMVNSITSDLNASINKYAEKLGDFASGIVTGVTQQLVNHYGQELVKNVVIMWNQMWGTTAQELGVRGFKLDWGQLGLQVLFSWASSNEHLAEIVSGIGRIFNSTGTCVV